MGVRACFVVNVRRSWSYCWRIQAKNLFSPSRLMTRLRAHFLAIPREPEGRQGATKVDIVQQLAGIPSSS